MGLYIKTLNNVKKSSYSAVHLKLLHDKMDPDSQLSADTQWIYRWTDRWMAGWSNCSFHWCL